MTSRKGKVAGQREKSNDECFEVERILDMKTFRNNKRRFLVSWKGYGTDEDSWEPEEGLRGARRLIEAYLKENGDKSRPTTSKAVAEQPEESSDSSYEVERILDMKILRNKKRKFLVHWKDYDSDENTWEPEENLNDDDARNLIKAFLKERENNPQPEKSKPAPKPMPKRAPKRQSPQKELEKEDKNNAESDENKSQPNKSKASQESMAKQTSTKKGQEKKNDNDAESDDSENDPVPAKSKTRNGLPRKKSLMSYTKPKSDEDSCESVDMSDESDVIEPRKMKSKNGPNHKTPVVIINWRYADSAPEAAGGSELMQHVPLAEVKHEAFPEN